MTTRKFIRTTFNVPFTVPFESRPERYKQYVGSTTLSVVQIAIANLGIMEAQAQTHTLGNISGYGFMSYDGAPITLTLPARSDEDIEDALELPIVLSFRLKVRNPNFYDEGLTSRLWLEVDTPQGTLRGAANWGDFFPETHDCNLWLCNNYWQRDPDSDDFVLFFDPKKPEQLANAQFKLVYKGEL